MAMEKARPISSLSDAGTELLRRPICLSLVVYPLARTEIGISFLYILSQFINYFFILLSRNSTLHREIVPRKMRSSLKNSSVWFPLKKPCDRKLRHNITVYLVILKAAYLKYLCHATGAGESLITAWADVVLSRDSELSAKICERSSNRQSLKKEDEIQLSARFLQTIPRSPLKKWSPRLCHTEFAGFLHGLPVLVVTLTFIFAMIAIRIWDHNHASVHVDFLLLWP